MFIRGKGSIKDPGKVCRLILLTFFFIIYFRKLIVKPFFFNFLDQKEDKLRGKPGYEHLNDPLHVLVEAELPANIIDARLRQAREIIEELLKPVVSHSFSF